MTASWGPQESRAFDALQARLTAIWPAMTVRGRPEPRTLVVLSSVSMTVPEETNPLLPSYEERYLSFVLSLVRAPLTRVIYVTSLPIMPRLLDYYLQLTPGLDDTVRSRLIPVSVGDPSLRPLTQKILERPLLIERLRRLITTPDHVVVLPFVTTELEARLALELDAPVYGPNPSLRHLGTKTGSRSVFAAVGVPHAAGVEGLRTESDLLDALENIVATSHPDHAIVKLDDAVSGFGNALIDLTVRTYCVSALLQ